VLALVRGYLSAKAPHMLGRDLFMAFFCVSAIGSNAQLTLLDPTFADNGTLLQGLSGFGGDNAEDVAIQPDGRIVVVGKRGGTEEDLAVLRLFESGVLDNSFSGNGVATVNIGVNAEGLAVALQVDGAIVVGGSAEFPGGSFDEIAFVRFTGGGDLDTSFSGDGVFTYTQPGASDAVRALAVQPDGKIIGAGDFGGSVFDMIAVRLTPDGTLDADFATGGIFNAGLHTGEVVEDMLLRPDGRILLVGAWRLTLPDADMAMLHLNADGAPDPTFGVEGLFRPSEANSVSAVVSAVEVDNGRVLIVGKRYIPGGNPEEIFTGRVLSDGTWDGSYGSGGRSFLALGSGYEGAVRDMVVLPEGKALLTVDLLDADDNSSIMVLRVLPDGGLDPSFGVSGRVVMPCPDGRCTVRSLALDGQGRVIAVGSYGSIESPQIMVMRWLAEASPLGQREMNAREAFRAYPLPTSDVLQLDVPAGWLTSARLELTDPCGRLITVFNNLGASGQRLELPGSLADGRYVLRLVSPSRALSAPVIVRH
jgi:uncharacterized delta-60 repeat protein